MRAFVALVVTLCAGACIAEELVDAEGKIMVQAHCQACHSLQLVTAQRGDREFWLDTIRWMQATQKLWPIPPAQEAQILDYLAEHYNESEWGRRPHLSPALMPAYATLRTTGRKIREESFN